MSDLMKRSVFLLGLLFSLTYSVYAQSNNTKVLIDTYRKGFLTNNKDSVLYQKAFFDAFPPNFKTFKSIYGWHENSITKLPLSVVKPSYFSRFFNIKSVDKRAMIKKMIKPAVNGVLYADAIATFQQSSFAYALANNKEFLAVLKTFSKKDIVSVWNFYFDYQNDTYRKGAYDKMVKETARNDKNMIPEITAGYKKATKRWASKQIKI